MSDLISRQAAIDAIQMCTDIFVNNLPTMIYKVNAQEALMTVPSAQPELIRCKDCRKNPKIAWVECPMAGKSQVFDEGYCHLGERREDE